MKERKNKNKNKLKEKTRKKLKIYFLIVNHTHKTLERKKIQTTQQSNPLLFPKGIIHIEQDACKQTPHHSISQTEIQ